MSIVAEARLRDWWPTRGQAVAVALLAGYAVFVAVVYALPLPDTITNGVSNGGFAILLIAVTIGVWWRGALERGLDRRAWQGVALSLSLTAVLFALDPAGPDEPLTLALDASSPVALSFLAALIMLGRRSLATLASARAALDVLWLAVAAAVVAWPFALDPLLAAPARNTAAHVSHVVFAVVTGLAGLAGIVLFPEGRGRRRVSFVLIGSGGVLICAAGVQHIVRYADGTLRFGDAWDYLWTIGLVLLGMAALVASPDRDEAAPRAAHGARWHLVVTVVPVVMAVAALLTRVDDSRTAAWSAIALVTVGAARTVGLVVENARLTMALAVLADSDELTGLANRRQLAAGLDRLGRRCRAEGRCRAVLYIDLDGFKEVNDRWGHAVGDSVLRAVGQRLASVVRSPDVIARIGGDEFVAGIVVPDEARAMRVARRVQRAVSGEYRLDVGTVVIGASIGVAVDDGEGSAVSLIVRADRALLVAKAREGTGHVEVDTPAGVA